MTRCAALIPARYASTRLPGKPLLKETGKYLVQHVYEQLLLAKNIDRILVATDDERILKAVRSFGGQGVMTRKDHASGTDRIAEACESLDEEIILNVQGDEPDMDPGLLDKLVDHMAGNRATHMATAATPIKDLASFESPHVVKTVLDKDNNALYFSRSPIPNKGTEELRLKHIGVYAFQREVLKDLTRLPPAPLEKIEKLEQLRALHHGMTIHVLITEKDHLGIDTQEEYNAFVKSYLNQQQAP